MSKEQMKTTPRKWYVNEDEQVLSSDRVNRHHVMFEEGRFKSSGLLKDLRELPGFFPHYMSIIVHNELHSHLRDGIGMPKIPNDNLINGMVQLQKEARRASSLERLDLTMGYLGKLAAAPGAPTPNSRDAWDLLENLTEQRPYILMGRVVLLDSK